MKYTSLSSTPRKIVVSAMPYLGDVLLATPLIHSLREAYPEAQIDVLVFKSTAAMLEGNPDIDQVLSIPIRPTLAESWALLKKIFRGYDLAMALQTSDRAFFYTLLASGQRVNAVPERHSKTGWKRFFADAWVEFDNEHTHTVLQNLKLLKVLGLSSSYTLVPPQIKHIEVLEKRFAFLIEKADYVVLHVHPQWAYKRWTDKGWIQIAEFLNSLGFKVILTGSSAISELAYISGIASNIPFETINLVGQVTLAELHTIISRAKLFIGPDTGITHLAAATGIPVIALYGPTNPVKWAPWPSGYLQNINPFQKIGSQQVGNIFVVQGKGDCVPCYLEGCDRHRESRSQCLEDLSPEQLKKTIDAALAWGAKNAV